MTCSTCGRAIMDSGKCAYCEPVVDGPGFGDYWTPDETPEPVVAPLPTEAVDAAVEAFGDDVFDRRWRRERIEAALRAALLHLRLVPEDDEDTVRVPREAVERLRAAIAHDEARGDDVDTAIAASDLIATLDGPR